LRGTIRVLNILLPMLSFLPWGGAPVRNRRWDLARQEGESGIHSQSLLWCHGPSLSTVDFCPQKALPTCCWSSSPGCWLGKLGLTLRITNCTTSSKLLSLSEPWGFFHP
jgi:hypothetical protein